MKEMRLMYKDPVVEELRQNAAKLVEECGHDLHKMAERLRQEQSRHAHRVIRRRSAPRQPGGPTPQAG